MGYRSSETRWGRSSRSWGALTVRLSSPSFDTVDLRYLIETQWPTVTQLPEYSQLAHFDRRVPPFPLFILTLTNNHAAQAPTACGTGSSQRARADRPQRSALTS